MKKSQILLVEDDRIIAKDIQKTLIDYGYIVLESIPSGEQALEFLENVQPDLILMDIRLEGDLSGIETATVIKNKYGIPIIFLTAYTDQKTLSEAKKTDSFGFIVKPYNEKELYATIELALVKNETEKRMRQTRKKIEHLHETAYLLSNSDNLKNIYQITVKAVKELLKFSYCSLITGNNNKLSVKAVHTDFPDFGDPDNFMIEDIALETIEKQTTICRRNSDYKNNDDFFAIISAPIGQFGVLQVISTREIDYNLEDVRLIELLVGHTNEAIKRVTLQNKLRRQAIHDPLTGLYNRYYLYQIISREKKLSKRYKHSIGFLIVDVNDLKDINDNYGHQAGDKALIFVAEILNKEARDTDIVVRYGGDEFVVMLPETGEEVKIVRERIIFNMEKWNKTENKFPFSLTFSIGEAHWNSEGGKSIDEVLAEADKKMYEHKKQYRQRKKLT